MYAKEVERLALFYQSLLGMTRVHATPELVILRSPDLQITIHPLPAVVAAQAEISVPPVPRDNAAYKFFHTVPSLAGAAEVAASLGGEVLPELWHGPGFVVRNAVDPEGNIFQVRESAS